ncbi:conserved hypothetical protein [Nitrobacter winogradskyi Nb-255]|uniref:Uncharacterized protein n=1 Tax=Nitrobacter winogradskyi (strain ATCC 25391 / DSM 10237 / CIP 104748 / NCIMB 11846 / Nb-255) TaxID=323098 RepID=Q3SP39_NITWN|nr:hypothetical protein [Nitrobacter winogradskyi]ABA05952.1 conserved hypothetical protein [Nitrobacter winogradskyi Nb-255]
MTPRADESLPSPPTASRPGQNRPDSAAALAAANINPQSCLATDYLNHFNEAIMLLEMIPDMPDCVEDFLNWRPMTYQEHFMASGFKAREQAIEAYENAAPEIRAEFDRLTITMTSILTAVAAATKDIHRHETRAALATEAVSWIKPMITRAGGIINGQGRETDVDYIMNH